MAGLLLSPAFTEEYLKPIGTIYINLLKFLVVPIVLLSITAGVISLKDIKRAGSVGLRSFAYYLVATAVAVSIGLALAALFKDSFPTLSSISTAGVSGAGTIMLAMVLTTLGIPVEGIALIAGVDKLFDMGRTALNIIGDATCALWWSTGEKRELRGKGAALRTAEKAQKASKPSLKTAAVLLWSALAAASACP